MGVGSGSCSGWGGTVEVRVGSSTVIGAGVMSVIVFERAVLDF